MTAESDSKSKDVWVGPSQAPWWKFKLAGAVWTVGRGPLSPVISRLPGAQRVMEWAFSVRVLSRDFEVVDDAE